MRDHPTQRVASLPDVTLHRGYMEEEPVPLPDFRLSFTLMCMMSGYEAREGESYDVARLEIMTEVQACLSAKLAQLNAEHDLNFGVIDFSITTIPSIDDYVEVLEEGTA